MTFVHIHKHLRHKLVFKVEQGVFVGYDEATKDYRIYLPYKHSIIVSCDVSFDEGRMYRADPSNIIFNVQRLLEL